MLSDHPPESERRHLKPRRFLFFAALMGAATLWRAMTIDFELLSQDELFFAPYHILGSAGFPVAMILLLFIPGLLVTTVVLLARNSPRPISAWLLTGLVCISYISIFLPPRSVELLYESSKLLSPVMMLLSVAVRVEMAAQGIKNQTVIPYCAVSLALAYWVCTSVLVAEISLSI